tara:strand:+ start:2773 stop:3024 length:252 start_codon:yes stop_codon:yes gene_type:complete
MKNKFKLAGITWIVKEQTLAECGFTDPNTATIALNSKLPPQSMEVTFYHELVHAIMFTMGEQVHDERFVEGFAQLLYQYDQQK